MKISYNFKIQKEYDKEKALSEARLGLEEVINKAKINKNVQKWLNGEEITEVVIEIANSIYCVDDYRISYIFNNKAIGYVKFCSGNSLDYIKISFCKGGIK